MRLSFHENPDADADLHPVYTETRGHDPRPGTPSYSTIYGEGADEVVQMGFVVSAPYRPTGVDLTIPLKQPALNAWVRTAVATVPIQMDLLPLSRSNPKEYYVQSKQRLEGKGFPPSNVYAFERSQGQITESITMSASFQGVLPSDCIILGAVMSASLGNNMGYSFGTIDIEEVSRLQSRLEFPQYSDLKDQLDYALVAENVGQGPGRFRLEGQEVFLEAGQRADLAKRTPFVVKGTKEYAGLADHVFVTSNPAPRRELPDLVVASSQAAQGATSPVRFLWIDETTVMLKGDAPGNDPISYEGLLVAREVSGEALPVVPLSGALAPLQELVFTVNDLKLLRLSFSREMRIAEYGRIRGDSASYEYSAPLPGPLYVSRVKILPLMGSRFLGVVAARVPAIRRL